MFDSTTRNRTLATAALAASALASLPLTANAAVRSTLGMEPAARGLGAAAVRLGGPRRDLGRMPAGAPVRVGIQLRYRNEAEVQQLTRLQGTKGSPYYHRYLSNAQWNAYFAPTPATLQRTLATLQRRGFRIAHVGTDRSFVDVTAGARTVEGYFSTVLHRTYETAGRRYAYVNVTPAVMPAELRDVAVSVAGLHSNDVASYPMLRRRAATLAAVRARRPYAAPVAAPVRYAAVAAATPKPITTSTPAVNPNPDPTEPVTPMTLRSTTTAGMSGGYGPATFAVAYDYPVQHGYDGTGQNIGNVISGDFADSDLTLELSGFGLKHTGTTTRIPVDVNFVPSSMSTTGDVGESSLDVEAMLGVAPGANYYEYLANTLADIAIEDAYDRVVSDDIVSVVNSSFGGCEADDPSFQYASNYIAMQGAAKGITFDASTGDTGGLGCNGVANGAPGTVIGVETPSTDYYFTAVGGTDLIANPTTGARTAETGWETGGGGVSKFEAIPDFQAGLAGTTATGRNTPDVAFDASLETGYSIYTGGAAGITGGTSLASPLMSGMQIEINQVQQSRNGWIVPRLYAIQKAQGYGFALTDIIAGTNEAFVAGTGYDNVTGLGTLDGWNLAGTE